MSRVDFIYLNEQEMIEAGVKDMKKCIDSIEDMFVLLHKGDRKNRESRPWVDTMTSDPDDIPCIPLP